MITKKNQINFDEIKLFSYEVSVYDILEGFDSYMMDLLEHTDVDEPEIVLAYDMIGDFATITDAEVEEYFLPRDPRPTSQKLSTLIFAALYRHYGPDPLIALINRVLD